MVHLFYSGQITFFIPVFPLIRRTCKRFGVNRSQRLVWLQSAIEVHLAKQRKVYRTLVQRQVFLLVLRTRNTGFRAIHLLVIEYKFPARLAARVSKT